MTGLASEALLCFGLNRVKLVVNGARILVY